MANETDLAGSVLARVMRVAKLDATGATPAGSNSMYVTDAIAVFSWQPDVESGLDLTQRKGNGDLAVIRRTPDLVRRYACTLQIAGLSSELEQMLVGGVVLTSGGNTVGYGAPQLGKDPNPNGASIEIWSEAWDGDVQASALPLIWHAFPKVKLERTAQRQLAADIQVASFEGFMYENPAWGNGPNNDWLLNSDRAWQRIRAASTTMPTPTVGLQAIPTQV